MRLLLLTVEALPTLLHISLFLFFAGLVVHLLTVNHTIFKCVELCVGVCTALYGCFPVAPIIFHDSPYFTPLSLPVWYLVIGIKTLILGFIHIALLALASYGVGRNAHRSTDSLAHTYIKRLRQGMQKTVEKTALTSPLKVDAHAFLWTFDSLDEDHELEHFFSGLPGFRSSKVVEDPLPNLAEEGKRRLSNALLGLLDCTISSDLLPELVKNRRATICKKAIDPAYVPFDVLQGFLFKHQYDGPLIDEIVQIATGWGYSRDEGVTLSVKATISMIVATVQRRDDPWFLLSSKSLGVPEAVLRDHAAHGDCLSLAILIHVTRQQFSHVWKSTWSRNEFSNVLREASKFNVQDTSPDLKHEFCALWNQIVRKSRDDHDRLMAFHVLGPIRNVYLALHQDTDLAPAQFSPSTLDEDDILDDPSSYPVCNIPGHHPDSTLHIHDHSHSTGFTPAVTHHHYNSAPIPSFLSSRPDIRFLSAHVRLLVDESLGDAPPLENRLNIPVSLDPIDQATTERRRIPVTSPNPDFTRATHGSIKTSARTMHLSTPEPWAFASALASAPKSNLKASPPDTVAVEHNADTCAPSDGLDVRSSPSDILVLDNILPSGSLLC